MTAQELTEILSKYSPTTRVGRIGHFGEFHELPTHSVYGKIVEIEGGELVIAIEPPHIGPEPD